MIKKPKLSSWYLMHVIISVEKSIREKKNLRPLTPFSTRLRAGGSKNGKRTKVNKNPETHSPKYFNFSQLLSISDDVSDEIKVVSSTSSVSRTRHQGFVKSRRREKGKEREGDLV